jgi:hypothetical protein
MKKVLLFFAFIIFHTITFAQESITSFLKDKNFRKYEGYFNFYWDDKTGKMYLEIDKFDTEFLYVNSLSAGLGSNDIGLDRGQLGQDRVVFFNRVGNKVLLYQPNLSYRAVTQDKNEKRAVEQSFAQSVLFGFEVKAAENQKVVVDITDFLLRDSHGVTDRIRNSRQGSYNLDKSRSAIYLPRTKNFPQNSEFEVTLTFTGGSDAGNYVTSVVPSPEAITLRLHHSFIQLPDNDYTPREYDIRSGYFNMSYFDYATPVSEPIDKKFIVRHRLKKKNPEAKISEPIKPIIYYLDNGTPEPIRSALLEGASWWNQAFEAAGYKDAFQVKVLPDDADPMDVRYNVINWVHRSTRGWSYGSSVTDPRTGEIIKGHVTLGSLRVRQDYLIFQGLLAPFKDGKIPADDKMLKAALHRLRQLAAHEVGHTLGIVHNFAASTNDRASVMDYPHPTLKLDKNGNIDLSDVYTNEIGEWDKIAIMYGYQDFTRGTDEKKALNEILENGRKKGLIFISDTDARALGGAHPSAHLWDNGKSPVGELDNILKIRQKALNDFSENNIRNGQPMGLLEDVLVPVYNLHRYQLEAVVKSVGGLNYSYANRDDKQIVTEIVSRKQQEESLESVLKCISPDVLTLPEKIIALIPPRPQGYYQTRELFQKRTGLTFDPMAAAEASASNALMLLFHPERANRLIEYKSRANTPGLDEVIEKTFQKTWKNERLIGLSKQIQFQTEQIVLTHLMNLATDTRSSFAVKAVAGKYLKDLKIWIDTQKAKTQDTDYQAHLDLALERIKNPEKAKTEPEKVLPPGQPIGMMCDFE